MLYKEDWENELKAAKAATEAHLKGYEINKELSEYFNKMVLATESNPNNKSK